MTDLYKKMNELDNKYDPGYDFEEETVDYLKSKFPEIYKLIIEEIKKDPTVIDPVAEVTPGRFVDHIGDRGEELLKEYEAILKKCARM
tara:strand:- start:77 stop:340 length:264 start_codon:yes stop_codon:yes gene_type:complete